MNPRAAIFMLIFAVLFGGVAYYLLTNVATFDQQARLDREIFDFSVPKVSRITAKRGASVVYDLEFEGHSWNYKFPPLGIADSGKVIRTISELRFEAKIREDITKSGGPISLEPYGFTTERLEVDIFTPGRNYIFQIGATNATKDGVYVRIIPGDRIYVTIPKVQELFDVSADFFKPSDSAAAPGPK